MRTYVPKTKVWLQYDKLCDMLCDILLQYDVFCDMLCDHTTYHRIHHIATIYHTTYHTIYHIATIPLSSVRTSSYDVNSLTVRHVFDRFFLLSRLGTALF